MKYTLVNYYFVVANIDADIMLFLKMEINQDNL